MIFTDGLPLTHSDYMIDRICDNRTPGLVPEPLRVQLVIARFAARVGTVMTRSAKFSSNGKTSGENLSLLALLEQDLIDMRASILEKLTGKLIHTSIGYILD